MLTKIILDLLKLAEKSKIRFLVKIFRDKKIILHASTLSFHSLMVVFPFLILMLWYLKSIGFTEEWSSQLQEFALTHLNINSGEQFNLYFKSILGNASGKSWGILSILVFVYSVISFFYRVGDTLDTILHEHVETSSDWRTSLIVFGKRTLVILLAPLFLVISAILKTWVQQSAFFTNVFSFPILKATLGIPLSYLIDFVTLFIVYQFFPSKRIKPSSSLKAAFISTIALSIGRWIISNYGNYAFTTHQLYGVAAAFILLLLWLQLAWIIFLVGLRLLETEKV